VALLTEGIEILVCKIDRMIDRLENLVVPNSILRVLIDKLFYLIIVTLILFTILFSVWIIWNPDERGRRFRYKSNNQAVWQGMYE